MSHCTCILIPGLRLLLSPFLQSPRIGWRRCSTTYYVIIQPLTSQTVQMRLCGRPGRLGSCEGSTGNAQRAGRPAGAGGCAAPFEAKCAVDVTLRQKGTACSSRMSIFRILRHPDPSIPHDNAVTMTTAATYPDSERSQL